MKLKRLLSDIAKILAALTLLLAYLIGFGDLNSLHAFYHESVNAVVHNAEVEKDPCHLRAFHNNNQKGCDHNFHITEIDECDLCDILSHSNHIHISKSNSGFKSLTPAFSGNLIPVNVMTIEFDFLSRAPPVI